MANFIESDIQCEQEIPPSEEQLERSIGGDIDIDGSFDGSNNIEDIDDNNNSISVQNLSPDCSSAINKSSADMDDLNENNSSISRLHGSELLLEVGESSGLHAQICMPHSPKQTTSSEKVLLILFYLFFLKNKNSLYFH